MTYDPNVFGYVDGRPTYSRDEFIYKKRRRGPITDDAELVAFAEKVTSGWYNAGWHQTFTTYYLGDYALSEPLDSMTIKGIQPAEGSPEGGATRGRSRRGRPLLRHLGLSEADTYITKHDIDDLVTVARIIREEAPAWQH